MMNRPFNVTSAATIFQMMNRRKKETLLVIWKTDHKTKPIWVTMVPMKVITNQMLRAVMKNLYQMKIMFSIICRLCIKVSKWKQLCRIGALVSHIHHQKANLKVETNPRKMIRTTNRKTAQKLLRKKKKKMRVRSKSCLTMILIKINLIELKILIWELTKKRKTTFNQHHLVRQEHQLSQTMHQTKSSKQSTWTPILCWYHHLKIWLRKVWLWLKKQEQVLV